jgi:pimeloyl-ACP methyl ester carboxylesterase
MQDVILAHGLWVPGLVMQPLAARLEHAGFCCHNFSYMGAGRPLAAHAERLASFAEGVGPAHFVGHSLGGLVILEALQRRPQLAAGRVVLLGTPVNGCYSGRRLARYPGGSWFLGASAELWREGRCARWSRPEALGVVAGTLPLGLGRLFGALPGVNDGVVRLEETAVEGMAERISLPVAHSAMLLSSRVAQNVASFLAEGRFSATAH